MKIEEFIRDKLRKESQYCTGKNQKRTLRWAQERRVGKKMTMSDGESRGLER